MAQTKIGTLKNGKIYRFDPVEIAVHWIHTVSFFALLITGLVLFAPGGAGWLAKLVGGVSMTRVLHRVFAAPYALLSLPLLVLFSPRGAKEWFQEMFHWDMDDVKLMIGYFPEVLGRHVDLPEAPKFNAGEKFNSLLTLASGLGLALSGIIMWWPKSFPVWLVRLAYPVHDLAFLGMCAYLTVHIFLSVAHPKMRAALEGMTTGWADAEFAKEHYGKWFRKVASK
jgi:formate dehydrogenase subunit gamma